MKICVCLHVVFMLKIVSTDNFYCLILKHLFPDSHEEMDHAEERQNLLAEEQKKIEVESKKVRLSHHLSPTIFHFCSFAFSVVKSQYTSNSALTDYSCPVCN